MVERESRTSRSVAIVAAKLLSKAHTSMRITGSRSVGTAHAVDVAELASCCISLALLLDSMSVVTIGSRRPDTMIDVPAAQGRSRSHDGIDQDE
ncbi:hypothetical protein EB74_03435 [Mycobacterium sp. SWH-M5]|nr:hypothetical protein EB74_03435 [Mycobacterium sp. SWH-M5]